MPRPLQVKSRAPTGRPDGLLCREQAAQVFIGGFGVADMELDGLANTDDVGDLDGPGIIGPHHVAHQEVAALECALVLVDHPADVQAILNSPLIVAGKLLKHVPQHLQRGAAAQLADDVLLGLGHDHRVPDRAAALAHDGCDRQRTAEQHRHRSIGKCLTVEHELIGPRDLAAAGHAADHSQPASLLVHLAQEIVGPEREGITQQENRGSLRVFDSLGPGDAGLARFAQPQRAGSKRPAG